MKLLKATKPIKRGVMRAFAVLTLLFFASATQAQQCPECVSADTCIKDFARATAQIKSDFKKGVAEQRKGREQTLRQQFAPRATLASEGDLGAVIRVEIDKLKDCLAKIH